MIYRKSLRLSNGARKQFSSGEITNLMSVDADKLILLPFLSNAWHAPIRIGVALYLLYVVSEEKSPWPRSGFTFFACRSWAPWCSPAWA